MDAHLRALTLEQLDAEIALAAAKLDSVPTDLCGGMSAYLAGLEAYREFAHGVPAPNRTMREREE